MSISMSVLVHQDASAEYEKLKLTTPEPIADIIPTIIAKTPPLWAPYERTLYTHVSVENGSWKWIYQITSEKLRLCPHLGNLHGS